MVHDVDNAVELFATPLTRQDLAVFATQLLRHFHAVVGRAKWEVVVASRFDDFLTALFVLVTESDFFYH